MNFVLAESSFTSQSNVNVGLCSFLINNLTFTLFCCCSPVTGLFAVVQFPERSSTEGDCTASVLLQRVFPRRRHQERTKTQIAIRTTRCMAIHNSSSTRREGILPQWAVRPQVILQAECQVAAILWVAATQ